MLHINKAKEKGILNSDENLPTDTLQQIEYILNRIRESFNLEIMIVSGGEFKWQCMIGKSEINDIANLSYVYANGTGEKVYEAITAALNEFITYFSSYDIETRNKRLK